MPKIMMKSHGAFAVKVKLKMEVSRLEDAISVIVKTKNDLDFRVAAKEDILQQLTNIESSLILRLEELNTFVALLEGAVQRYTVCDQKTARMINELEHMLSKTKFSLDYILSNNEFLSKLLSPFKRDFALSSASEEDLEYALYLIRQAYLDKYIGNTNDIGVLIYNSLNEMDENDYIRAFGSYTHINYFMQNTKGTDVFLFGVSNWWDTVVAGAQSIVTGENVGDTFLDNPEMCKGVLRSVINNLMGMEDAGYINGDFEVISDTYKSLSERLGFKDSETLIDLTKYVLIGAEGSQNAVVDYAQNVAMLESIKQTAPGNSTLSEVIDDLIQDYENQFVAELKGIGVTAAEDITKEALKGTPLVGSVIKTEEMLQKIVNAAAKDEISAIETALYSSELLYSGAIPAFRENAEIMMSGNFTDEDVNNYINSFNVAKGLTLENYNAMLDYCDAGSNEANYLKEQIDQLENSTYDNYNFGSPYDPDSKY